MLVKKTFKVVGFKIEIKTYLKTANIFNVTLRLNSGTYSSYKKSNDKVQYINTLSNNPPQIIKQLPTSINERLSKNSITKRP